MRKALNRSVCIYFAIQFCYLCLPQIATAAPSPRFIRIEYRLPPIDGEQDYYDGACSGFLIGPNLAVIDAACFPSVPVPRPDDHILQVLNADNEFNPVSTHQVRSIVIHPGFNIDSANSNRNNVALVRFEGAADGPYGRLSTEAEVTSLVAGSEAVSLGVEFTPIEAPTKLPEEYPQRLTDAPVVDGAICEQLLISESSDDICIEQHFGQRETEPYVSSTFLLHNSDDGYSIAGVVLPFGLNSTPEGVYHYAFQPMLELAGWIAFEADLEQQAVKAVEALSRNHIRLRRLVSGKRSISQRRRFERIDKIRARLANDENTIQDFFSFSGVTSDVYTDATPEIANSLVNASKQSREKVKSRKWKRLFRALKEAKRAFGERGR